MRPRRRAVSSSDRPWCARSGGHAPLFQAQAGGGAVRFEVGRVDHQRVCLAALIGQFEKLSSEDALLAPPLPTFVKRLQRAIGSGRIPPAQTIAIDEDYAAQHALVIHTRHAVGLRKKGLQLGHLRVGQPIKIAHLTAPFSEP